MSIWSEVRREADEWHGRLTAESADLVSAPVLLAAAETDTGIVVQKRPAGDALLDGAEATHDRLNKRIYYSAATDPDLAHFHIAHEFAHHKLEEQNNKCAGDDINIATVGEPEMSWVGDPDAYSPKERAEALANVFAREFLLPRPLLRALCQEASFDAEAIAKTVQVPVELVMQQLADALLLPVAADAAEELEPERDPDDTQRQAIEAADGPMRVLAGPGTGKTRTLVGRVAHLLEHGTDSKSVAILTFSNLSAQDLAARLRLAIGEKATGLWVGTFHAFGLELLRKRGQALGLEDIRLIDRSGSLNLLLELLPNLELKHFLDLNEPLRRLGSVAQLISRAKDELATPSDYERAARAQAKDDPEAAEQSLEVARAYALYERALRERGWVDFGDLIARAVELLREHLDIRAQVRAQYTHILVDEYQDMNRASGVFLTWLTEPQRGPWVVGDVRQAIYRFRGASPVNLENFEKDFPGARTRKLEVNYRSGGKIIRTFEAFGGGSSLNAFRGEDRGKVDLKVATTQKAEYEGIANAILAAVKQGGHFGDHAILARSHTTLARLSRHLEARSVPCLYFGDFFERPEIRNLLALLQLASEGSGVGLVRVAKFPEYGLSDADLSTLLAWQAEQEKQILHTLRNIDIVPNLSASGKDILRRITRDLRDVDFPQTPHTFLINFLFRRGDHLSALLADKTVAGQQQRLAIYQLLQFCFSFHGTPKADPKRSFLEHVRRLELLDEEKQLRGLPAGAVGIDAVRLMTIHASKGLQFSIVHIPTLTARHFPNNRKDLNALPPGLSDASALMTREAEEEALFFVALSRARDELHLSRAVNNGAGSFQNCKPSSFLERIRAHLPIPPDSNPTWSGEGAAVAEPPEKFSPPPPRSSWPARTVETYLECPRKFYYAEVLDLRPREARSPFLKTDSALRSSIEWLQKTASAEERTKKMIEQFKADWEAKGPRGHPLESLYRRAAEQMVETAAALMQGKSLPVELALSMRGGITVTARADHISLQDGRVLIQRLKQGRLAKKETHKLRYAILQAAARQAYAGASVQFEHVSLLTSERSALKPNEKAIAEEIKEIEGALTDIAAGRFPVAPNQYCPQCPFYFFCPTHFRIDPSGG
jgi:superfamily I DNA/RNA helicase/CRISPR/Cas system-associated exonuclease Cas4 (RecB family)